MTLFNLTWRKQFRHTPRTSSWQLGGSLHTQKDEEDHSIDHEYHLVGQNDSVNMEIAMTGELSLPQILMGASSSSRTGWEMKISRDLMQSQRISFSVKFTCLPGRAPRTDRSCSMIWSTSKLSSVIGVKFSCGGFQIDSRTNKNPTQNSFGDSKVFCLEKKSQVKEIQRAIWSEDWRAK